MDRLSIFYLCIGITFLHNIALSSSTNETNRNERKISHQKPHIIIIAADDMVRAFYLFFRILIRFEFLR